MAGQDSSPLQSAVGVLGPQKPDSKLLALVILLLLQYTVGSGSGSGSSSSDTRSLDHRIITTSRNKKTFLWLSDIHFDPFYGTGQAYGQIGANCFQEASSSNSNATTNTTATTSMGQIGCDAPFQLVNETIRQAAADARKSQNADYFVILTGDLCRHGNDKLDDPIEGTKAILANISHLLRQTLGEDVSIIPSLGNNDVTPDYYLDVDNPTELLAMVSEGLEVLFDESNDNAERQTFERGGYFARNVSDSLTIISLNTILYSTNHIPDKSQHDDDDDPLGQFEWLEDQMQMACLDRSVYIIGHIPPVMGSYRHSQLWKTEYLTRYYSILQRTSPCMTIQLFGHLHVDEFRSVTVPPSLLEEGSDDGIKLLPYPLLLASSVTPVYGSNPSYRWLSYEPEIGTILGYDTHYLNLLNEYTDADLLQWKQGPSFFESYGVEELSFEGIHDLIQGLNESMQDMDSPLWKALLERQHIYASGGNDLSCRDISCRREWICTLTTITSETFAECLAFAGANPVRVALARLSLRQRILAGSVLALVIVVIFCFCLCRCFPRYLQRRQYQQQSLQEDADEHVLKKDGSLPMHSYSTSTTSTDTRYNDDDDMEVSELPSIT